MKSILIETTNVKKANNMVRRMQMKKGADMTLIYGHPGTGKSHYAKKNFAPQGWGYYRIETMETPKSFLREIYRSLSYEYSGRENSIKGDGAAMAKAVIDLFQDVTYQREQTNSGTPLIFVIDEINLAIQHRKWQIIELIRDFRDIADAKIIMIGEEDTKKRLEKYNSHFFNRCSNFCEFDIASKEDMITIISKTMEIQCDKEVAAMLVQRANGSLHHLEVLIKEMEQIAIMNGLNTIGVKDIVISTSALRSDNEQ